MPGPYFEGQEANACGHYYPDVLRLRDERKQDGTFVRIVDCKYCGKYEFPLDIRQLGKQLQDKLKRSGVDVEIRDSEVTKVRQKNLDKFAKKTSQPLSAASLKLETILAEAISGNAKSIELEWVSEGLEMTFISGNFGLGTVLRDKKLAGEIIELIIEKAKIQNKARGKMAWAIEGNLYQIDVETYENFGENAYRLKLKKG